MTAFRHLDYPPETPPERLGLAALDALLERGDLDAWAPLARAIGRDPHGELAESVLHLCRAHPMYGTSALWERWIADRQGAAGPHTLRLRDLRKAASLTQAQVARRLHMSQGDVSKLEGRADALVSTLRAYARAVGARLHLLVQPPGGDTSYPLKLGDPES